MERRTIVIMLIILTAGVFLRLWGLSSSAVDTAIQNNNISLASFSSGFDFFKLFQTSDMAPLYHWYLQLWSAIFNDSTYIYRLASFIPNIAAVIVLYFAGVEFASNKKNEKNKESVGLTAFGLSAISAYLILCTQETVLYSLVFFFAALTTLASLRFFREQSNKNGAFLAVSSVLLLLTHFAGIVYVFFNTIALIVFISSKARKKDAMPFVWSFIGILILLLPVVPFVIRMSARADVISQWWGPFSWHRIYFYFTDIFSPVIERGISRTDIMGVIVENTVMNFGFIIFALIPAIICLGCVFRNLIKPQKIQMYVFAATLCSYLVILIAAIAGKVQFLTGHLIELYPLFILLAAQGFAKLKSKPLKIVLGTTYVVITLFFIIAARLAPVEIAYSLNGISGI